MTKKIDNRISPSDAREFAHKVHSTGKPVFLREYNTRTMAGTRRWEFTVSRQVFEGLGLEFFVDLAPGGAGESGPWGVWARPSDEAANAIAYLDNGVPCLILDPASPIPFEQSVAAQEHLINAEDESPAEDVSEKDEAEVKDEAPAQVDAVVEAEVEAPAPSPEKVIAAKVEEQRPAGKAKLIEFKAPESAL